MLNYVNKQKARLLYSLTYKGNTKINLEILLKLCGCNPLSFRASSLHPQCIEWQHTYVY